MLLAWALVAAAAGLWWPRERRDRLHGLGLPRGDDTAPVAGPAPQVPGRPWWMSPWLSCAVTVFAVTRVVPGVPGLVVGCLAAAGVAVVLRTASTAAEVRRRQRVQADLPLAVDLLVSCVAAGRPPGQSLAAVATAVGGPLGEELRLVVGRLELGADPVTVWRDLSEHEALAPLGRSLARSARTGSSIRSGLARCADDLRSARRAAAQVDARKVSVRASAPLGVCFLPAFFLIGIVPTIVGGVRSVSW